MEISLLKKEWEQIVKKCALFSSSECGAALITSYMNSECWAGSVEEATGLQTRTQEASEYASYRVLWNQLEGLKNPFSFLERLEKDGVLNEKALFELQKWLDVAQIWKEFPQKQKPLFQKEIGSLQDCHWALVVLEKTLDLKGQIREDASAELWKLQKQKKQLEKKRKEITSKELERLKHAKCLQDDFYDLRDGRVLFPLKMGGQKKQKGWIRAISASEQTVFFETETVFFLNEELLGLEADIALEKWKLLRNISKTLRKGVLDFKKNIKIIAQWDAAHAKAQYASHFLGKPIKVVSERRVCLFQTAHPLLWETHEENQIVKNSFFMTPDFQALFLTGPNGGGKTVFLKMLGLAVFASRTGFFLPGTKAHTFPFFKSVFADIGDPQDIEQSLSSFAGHLLFLKRVWHHLKKTPSTLILLDEWNTSTDPVEGRALAQAWLEALLEKWKDRKREETPFLAVTVHDPFLKALARKENAIFVGAFDFDLEKKTPSFHLLWDRIGEAHALELAEKLKWPEKMLQRAKAFFSEKESVLNKWIQWYEHARIELEALKRNVMHQKQTLQEEKKQFQEEKDLFLEKEKAIFRKKFQELYEKTKEKLKIQYLKFIPRRKEKGQEHVFFQAQKQVQKEIMNAQKWFEPKKTESAHQKAMSFQIGNTVRVLKMQCLGEVISVKKDKLQVVLFHPSGARSGLVTTVFSKEVELVAEKSKKSLPVMDSKTSVQWSVEKPEQVPLELDLRGKTAEEAKQMLSQYLDQAFRAQMQKVWIIHGIGTGVLRNMTQEFLKKSTLVKKFSEQNFGSTCVELEEG